MKLHLKAKEGTQELVEKIEAFCQRTNTFYQVEDYKYFLHMFVDTSLNSTLSAIFLESNYDRGDYAVKLYSCGDYADEIIISLEFIDCLFSL